RPRHSSSSFLSSRLGANQPRCFISATTLPSFCLSIIVVLLTPACSRTGVLKWNDTSASGHAAVADNKARPTGVGPPRCRHNAGRDSRPQRRPVCSRAVTAEPSRILPQKVSIIFRDDERIL